MNVDYVVLPKTKDLAQLLSQLESPRKARLRSIGVNRLTLADANDVHLVARARNVRRDYVDLVTVTARFAREEMNVLADAAQVRVVILGDECDP